MPISTNRTDKSIQIPLILASGSVRRHELLTQAGLDFTVMTANIDEQIYPNEPPIDYIMRMVRQKAEQSIIQLQQNPLPLTSQNPPCPFAIILTADTIGVLPNQQKILIKPKDKEDAFAMWRQMSGTTHQVYTAVQAHILHFQPNKQNKIHINSVWQKSLLESTDVQFIQLTDHDMQQYWDTGEPLDKAGGYAIQGKAMAWVSHIRGSYTNVVGLPLAQTIELLKESYQWIIDHQSQ